MSFLGIQSSDQRNIVKNNVDSSVSNSSANISKNTLANTQTGIATAKLVNRGEIRNCATSVVARVDQQLEQNINIYSETDTSFDTTLSTNIINDMKNKVKQNTPSLYDGFLSSQVNRQINNASNDIKNEIANDIYVNRQNQVANSQTAAGQAEFINDGVIDCSRGGSITVNGSILQRLQSSFIERLFDKAAATSGISVALTNKFRNDAEQTGSGLGDWIAGLVFLGVMVFIFIPVMKFAKRVQGSGNIKSGIKTPTTLGQAGLIGFRLLLCVVFVILFNQVYTLTHDDDSYEGDPENTDEICKGTGTTLIDEFETNQSLIKMCINQETEVNDWENKRNALNFSATDTNGVRRSGEHLSLRGIIEENGVKYDYTLLNENPYEEGIECGSNGLDVAGNKILGCRTITEDYQWESLINKACGCCDCDPAKIGYYDEWSDARGVEGCTLDDSRPPGVFCDKGLEILQPGVGYKTDSGYETTCRNISGGKCKKKVGDTLVDLGDDDEANITVKLISDTDCHGSSPSTNKCYKTAATEEGVGWTDITQSVFGDNSGVLCDMTEPDTFSAGVSAVVAGATNTCPTTVSGVNDNGCVKGDACRIEYLNAMKTEATAARAAGRDIVSQEGSCDQVPTDDGTHNCIYKIHGVREVMVETVPDDHVSSPNNVYTIKKKTGEPTNIPLKYVMHNDALSQTESVWVATSFIHASNGPAEDYSVDYALSATGLTECPASTQSYTATDVTTGQTYNYPRDGTTDLCECKFRRLPACAFQSEGVPTNKFGCTGTSNAASQQIGSCMGCISESGDVSEPEYNKKLKDDINDTINIYETVMFFIIIISGALALI
jgi:hypothetical protein